MSVIIGYWKDVILESIGIPLRIAFFKFCPFYFELNLKYAPDHIYIVQAQTLNISLHLRKHHRPLIANSNPISVYQQCIELIRDIWAMDQTPMSVCVSCLSVSVHAHHPSWTAPAQPWLLKQHNSIVFKSTGKNNLWIINQHDGVLSQDRSDALTGPQGLWWRESKLTPLHPLLVQIKIKAALKGPACAEVIWGPVSKHREKYLTDSHPHIVRSKVYSSHCDCLHKVQCSTAKQQKEGWACHILGMCLGFACFHHCSNAGETEGCWERDWCT